jgi:hypothetical protein
VLARVGELARLAVAEAGPAAAEVAAMPGGDHAILDATRRAVEQRARVLLAGLEEPDDEEARVTPARLS